MLIIGSSGAGKSTSIGEIPELNIQGLNPKETMIISSIGKELPWRNSGKQYISGSNLIITSHPRKVLDILHGINKNMLLVKNVVIDDNTHISSMEYMRRINEKTYDKFNDIADYMSRTALDVKTFRDDLCVFFLHHSRDSGDGVLEEKHTNAMTIGKLVDEKLSGYESFFTVVLRAVKRVKDDEVEYKFLTKDANSTAKTPIGMFESVEINNDLGMVRQSIDCYYNDEDCKQEEKENKQTKKK